MLTKVQGKGRRADQHAYSVGERDGRRRSRIHKSSEQLHALVGHVEHVCRQSRTRFDCQLWRRVQRETSIEGHSKVKRKELARRRTYQTRK